MPAYPARLLGHDTDFFGLYRSRQRWRKSTSILRRLLLCFQVWYEGHEHCAEKHLHRHRYVAKFDFRYSNRVKLGIDDVACADRALVGVKGKRLTYRTPD
jgi:hypothetical protein